MCGHQRDDDIAEDFCDSLHAKCHPLFGRNKTALQLLLFYDDLEVCNPIGSSRKKHKIGVTYTAACNMSTFCFTPTMHTIELRITYSLHDLQVVFTSQLLICHQDYELS